MGRIALARWALVAVWLSGCATTPTLSQKSHATPRAVDLVPEKTYPWAAGYQMLGLARGEACAEVKSLFQAPASATSAQVVGHPALFREAKYLAIESVPNADNLLYVRVKAERARERECVTVTGRAYRVVKLQAQPPQPPRPRLASPIAPPPCKAKDPKPAPVEPPSPPPPVPEEKTKPDLSVATLIPPSPGESVPVARPTPLPEVAPPVPEDPSYDEQAIKDLGAKLIKKGQNKKLLATSREWVEKWPGKAIVQYFHGRALFLGKQIDAAAEALSRATTLDPALEDAHYELGGVLLALKKKPEACKALQEYVRLAPGGKETPKIKKSLKRMKCP